MENFLHYLTLLIAALLAGIMGFAIQRGATCTVAAMDEIVEKRRAHRLTSMFEASVWVAGGFILAEAFGLMPSLPAGRTLGIATVAGGVLLGVGAYVNQACVFGAIARLGSGEWAYALTPVGFYVGCASLDTFVASPSSAALTDTSPVFVASRILAVPIGLFMLWRIAWPAMRWWRLWRVRGSENSRDRYDLFTHEIAIQVWSPHAATGVIGVTFFFLLMMMGAWAYTDVLADLARGISRDLFSRFLLSIALLAGAMVGGWTAGRFARTRVTLQQASKCLLGGAMMGWGSLLIPGSNDGLILLGMPLLWPYAWAAFLTMCVSIGAIMLVRKLVMNKQAQSAA